MSKLKVASLFCGCGGSDLGMIGGFEYLGKKYKSLDFEIVYAVDFDPKAVETYNANFKHKAVCADVTKVDFNDIDEDIDVMIGGFPCQSFSTVNPTKNTNDARANLYKEIVRFLHTKKPKYFICENVKGLLTLQKGEIIRKIVREFNGEGYFIQYRLLKAVEYGIPQRRERVIIVGIRKDMDILYSYPTGVNTLSHAVPLNKVIDNLAIDNQKYYFSERAVQGMKNAKNNMKRGLWQDLNSPCLTITSHLAKTSINSRDPVLMVDPDKEIYRRFTPREAARIQSFPDDFSFPVTETSAYRQIGNAVPPVFMWYVAEALQDCIKAPNKEARHYPTFEELESSKNWVQQSLFEPRALYISKKDKETLIAYCSKTEHKKLSTNMMFNYKIKDSDIEKHPELLRIRHLILHDKKAVIGYYIVDSVGLANSSTDNNDTRFLTYELEGTSEPIPIIRENNFDKII